MGTKGNTSTDFKCFLLSFYFFTAFSPSLSVISDHHFKTTSSSGNSSYSFVKAFMIASKTFQAIILFNISQSHSLSGYQMHFSFSSAGQVAWLCCMCEVLNKCSELNCTYSHFSTALAQPWWCISIHMEAIC